MKNFNQARVCRLVWQKRGISRVAIAHELKLDKSTITNIISQLLKEGIVQEVAVGSSTPQGGRRPIQLTINKDYGLALGFEVQPDYWRACVINLEGEIIADYSQPVQIDGSNIVKVIKAAVSEVKAKLKVNEPRYLGIGLGLSGVVNAREGKVIQSLPLQIENPLDLARLLVPELKLPVLLDNDANCCAWGEIVFHKNPHLINFISVLIELRGEELLQRKTGGLAVGLGLVIDAKVYTGSHSAAGEFLSVFASPEAVSQFSLSAKEILNLNTDQNVFQKFAVELSENLAFLANVLDITDIFMCIHNINFQDQLIATIKAKIKEKYPYHLEPKCNVRLASVIDRAVAYGAAALVLENFFSNEEG